MEYTKDTTPDVTLEEIEQQQALENALKEFGETNEKLLEVLDKTMDKVIENAEVMNEIKASYVGINTVMNKIKGFAEKQGTHIPVRNLDDPIEMDLIDERAANDISN